MSKIGLASVSVRSVCTLVAALTVLSACPNTKSHEADAGPRAQPDAGPDGSTYLGDGGKPVDDPAHPRCLRIARKIAAGPVDKLDLLLVVDNSSTMAGEQAALRAQFPRLIRALTTGMRRDDDPEPFPPVKDLHVGVVSTDMGIPGVEYASCHADGGDDGKLQNTPRGEGCDPVYPEFLSFIGDARIGPVVNPEKLANDLGCIANLGTNGCLVEQPLEAAFKAVWPKDFTDARGNLVRPNPFRFIATTESGTFGRGDQPGNRGFLRNDPRSGNALLAVVIVTDDEDCSVKDTSHLKPGNQLPEDSPYRQEDFNLRCFLHPEFLYDLKARYYNGLRALRPGREDQVVFAVIAGVPTDLVDREVLAQVDFAAPDSASREAFYTTILNDSRMVQRPDPTSNPGTGSGNLVPSCVRPVPNEDSPSAAYPPRRLVELARQFGPNGMVQSICQDLEPAVDAVTNLIASRLHVPCLGRAFARKADGKIACDVVWELPANAPAGSSTPTQCDQYPFLSPVDPELMLSDAQGGVSCKVAQLAVSDPKRSTAPAGEGWYYDDFTEERARECRAHEPQRIAFTNNARPPSDVVVKLACRSPLARVAANAARPNPVIGSPCNGSDEQCLVQLEDDTTDASLFCHPQLQVCAKSCTADVSCPRGWTCKREGVEHPFCIHPKCGD